MYAQPQPVYAAQPYPGQPQAYAGQPMYATQTVYAGQPTVMMAQQQPTVVVVNQAPMGPQIPVENMGAWRAGLFDCFETDLGGCIFACFLPFCAYGMLKQNTGQGDCCGSCCIATLAAHAGFYACVVCSNRTGIRLAFNIPGNACEDYIVHLFCDPCAMVQEAAQYGKRLL